MHLKRGDVVFTCGHHNQEKYHYFYTEDVIVALTPDGKELSGNWVAFCPDCDKKPEKKISGHYICDNDKTGITAKASDGSAILNLEKHDAQLLILSDEIQRELIEELVPHVIGTDKNAEDYLKIVAISMLRKYPEYREWLEKMKKGRHTQTQIDIFVTKALDTILLKATEKRFPIKNS